MLHFQTEAFAACCTPDGLAGERLYNTLEHKQRRFYPHDWEDYGVPDDGVVATAEQLLRMLRKMGRAKCKLDIDGVRVTPSGKYAWNGCSSALARPRASRAARLQQHGPPCCAPPTHTLTPTQRSSAPLWATAAALCS